MRTVYSARRFLAKATRIGIGLMIAAMFLASMAINETVWAFSRLKKLLYNAVKKSA